MGEDTPRARSSFRGRGGGRGGFKHRGKGGSHGDKRDKGRAEHRRNPVDRRPQREDDERGAKRQKLEGLDGEEKSLPVYATKFSQEEIEAQDRRPKRKVAVMIGYSGTGYKGMQVSPTEKTVEGDLFAAFVAAGAISKANADNPQKSSLVRCARTDKGVHAAGNLISLKLVIEDPDIISRINENLNPQIRVWGIERTNGSFSAYQFCDSRVYEYLIPTYCFLPPNPRSFLGKKILELAKEGDDVQEFEERQGDALTYWSDFEEKSIKPLFENHDQELVERILEIFYETGMPSPAGDASLLEDLRQFADTLGVESLKEDVLVALSDGPEEKSASSKEMGPFPVHTDAAVREVTALDRLLRHLKDLQLNAKKSYRIPAQRLARVSSTFARFVGSHKFHNYTIDKTFKDASATRVIKSFTVGPEPIIINGTEWLSLKVHGQSFMMHQIRKMVSMAALVVRCGCHEARIQDTYLPQRLSIPKAPSVGLLLERPVFDGYNKKLEEFGRASIDFSRHEKEIEEFKHREIYQRIFETENIEHSFHTFFTGLDQTRSAQLLFLTSLGLDATKREIPNEKAVHNRKGADASTAADSTLQDPQELPSDIAKDKVGVQVFVTNIDDLSSDNDEKPEES